MANYIWTDAHDSSSDIGATTLEEARTEVSEAFTYFMDWLTAPATVEGYILLEDCEAEYHGDAEECGCPGKQSITVYPAK